MAVPRRPCWRAGSGPEALPATPRRPLQSGPVHPNPPRRTVLGSRAGLRGARAVLPPVWFPWGQCVGPWRDCAEGGSERVRSPWELRAGDAERAGGNRETDRQTETDRDRHRETGTDNHRRQSRGQWPQRLTGRCLNPPTLLVFLRTHAQHGPAAPGTPTTPSGTSLVPTGTHRPGLLLQEARQGSQGHS